MSNDRCCLARAAVQEACRRLDAAQARVERADRTIALSDKLVAQAFEDLSVSRGNLRPVVFTV